MDTQEPREAVQAGRLGSTTKDWFVPTAVSRGFCLTDSPDVQVWEIQIHRRLARLASVGVKCPPELGNGGI